MQHQNKKLFKIITVAGDPIYKGIDTIARASELLNIFIDFEWVIVGINKESFIYNYIRKKYRNNRLKFVGNLGEEKLVFELLSSDLFVSVSNIENSPNNIYEAINIGMPIICSYVGGTSSLFKNNINNIPFIQNGDYYNLAALILDLYKDPKKAIKIAENNFEISKAFNKDSVAITLFDNYKSCIKDFNDQNKK